MAKYSEGTYLIALFDKYGTKIETRLAEHQQLIGAQKEAAAMLSEVIASFAIMRVMTNSIDTFSKERWSNP